MYARIMLFLHYDIIVIKKANIRYFLEIQRISKNVLKILLLTNIHIIVICFTQLE